MRRVVCENCRKTRLALTGLLIVVSAIAGYHWGTIIINQTAVERLDLVIAGVMLVLVVLVVGFGIDSVVSRVEEEAMSEGRDIERLTKEARAKDAQISEISMALESLAEDNSRLRELLVSHNVRGAVAEGGG